VVEACLIESHDVHRSHCPNMHVIESYSDSSDDENKECCIAEFVWPTRNKSFTCPSLKLIHKNWQEDMEFTFDPAREETSCTKPNYKSISKSSQ
jgi:hypothetical protein